MCGIAGFYAHDRGPEILERMTQSIRRRGPDDYGTFVEDGIALGHRRLAIIDLSPLGHQPMEFEDLVLVYNGEIYNYREVQAELKAEGYDFVSSSDSEVVIKAFHRWGPTCVNRFIGMFAIAMWNRRERALYLIRDRAGVKPLYYYHKSGRIAFGSELRALRPFLTPDERADIDTEALSEFFSYGYISSGLSIIKSVRKLPPAHYLKFTEDGVEIRRYWDVEFEENPDWLERSEEDLLDELDSLVVSAFRYRMVADVPVGVFLSSGVDSALVASVLARHHGSLSTFTIGFEEREYDESGDARRIAEHLGTDHHEAVLTADRAHDLLDHFYDIYDEPHGDNSCIPTTFVSGLAKENGMKVVLSADAGDELFGGYRRYVEFMRRWQQVASAPAAARAIGRQGFRALARIGGAANQGRFGRYAELMDEQPFIRFSQTMLRQTATTEYRRLIPAFSDRFSDDGGGAGELLNQLCEWDFKRYMVDDNLVKVDRATMYHSIEGREPFLDHRLVEFAAQLPTCWKIRDGETKYLLKRLLGRYLPEPLFRLPKRGFAAPLDRWVKQFYQERFLQVLERGSDSFFDRGEVGRLLDRYRSSKPVNYWVLWYMFSFQSWYDRWMAAD
jgi:asparagine synthase (glutamine-hydrolysing)